MHDLRFRFTIILLTILAACYLLWPTYKFYSSSEEHFSSYPQNKQKEIKDKIIALGLDLQGGMYVVLEIDIATLLKNIASKSSSKHFEELETAINMANNLSVENQTDFFDEFKAIIDAKNIRLVKYYADYSESRDNDTILEMLMEKQNQAVNSTLKILNARINSTGLGEPNIQRYGKDRIIVELAGVSDSKKARSLIKKTGSMEFLLLLTEKMGSVINQIDDYLIQSNYEPSINKTTLNKENKNDLDDIFSDVEDANLNFSDDYTTSKEILKKAPFSGYIVPLSPYEFGIAVNEVDAVKKILNDSSVKKLIPQNTKFIWGTNIETVQTETGSFFDYMPLYYAKSEPVISGGMLKKSKVTIAPPGSELSGQYIIEMELKKQGARKWSRFTGANKNKQVAIVLEGQVYMAPVIRDKIPSGKTQISGFSSAQEAQEVVNVLAAGEMAAPVNILQERTIGPSLGNDSIILGKQSMIIGVLLVMLFMAVYYKGAGLIANFAMFLNLIIVMAILAMLNWMPGDMNVTLTFPGIAGLILTIGMAVDANVIIFERIQEELAVGKTPISAMHSGYERAFVTILDANLTTLIAACMLAFFGSGTIQGFATTLGIGIICSMFTAIFVTKTIYMVITK